MEKENAQPADTAELMPDPAPDGSSDQPEAAVSAENPAAETEKEPDKLPGNGRTGLIMTIAAYLLAFCIPTAIGLLMYKVKEVAPFGDNAVLCMDLWGQYTSMYAQLAQGETLADLFYSWNGAFGYNNWAQSAYYCNSIFLLPLRLVSMEHLVNYINWICLLKLGFASMSCLAFLRCKTKSTSLFLIAGASAYSLCAYMLAYLSQPMWTDSLIYAPLVLIGMERMLHDKKPLMYTLMLALTICSSFYIGFTVCIFCCLYFAANALPVLRIGTTAEGKHCLLGLKDFGRMTGRFSAFSMLAGAVAAPVILPIAQAVGLTIASEAEFPEKLKWYGNFSYVFKHMLSEQPLCVEYTGANLSVGMIAFLLLPLYFLNKKIPAIQRTVNGAVLGFLALSLNCNYLDFMWHGFHFPNQLPVRWSFLFSLFAVLLICTAFINLKGLSLSRTVGGIIIGFLAAFVGIRGVGDVAGTEVRRVYLILMGVSALLILAVVVFNVLRSYAAERTDSRLARIPYSVVSMFAAAALAMVCIVDSGMSYIKTSQFEHGGTRVNDGAAFTQNAVKQYTYGSEWASRTDDFYRVEANGGYTFNPSMLGGYHGMGYYSSTMRGNTFKLLRSLGNRVYADKVSSVYTVTSPVQNSLFGIRYYIDYARELDRLPATEIIQTDEVCDIVENTTALSLAYGVSDKILALGVSDQIRGIENQNTLLNAIVGEDVNVFRKLSTTEFSYENTTLTESADWNENYFHSIDNAKPVTFHYVYTCDTDGAVYLEHNFRAGTITVTWDGGSCNVDQASQKFAYLGNFTAGTAITIDVSVENVQLGCVGMNLYAFDEALWNSTYEKLSAVQMDVESFKANRVKGTITMPQNQLVMTTIPQDSGWTAYCDGKKAEIMLAPGDLICLIVPEGTHTLEFKYHVPMLGTGVTISVIALLICVWFSVPELRRLILAKISGLRKTASKPAAESADA